MASCVPLFLAAKGVNVNAVTAAGHTPLLTAVLEKRYAVAKALLEQCTTLDLSAKDAKSGRTALACT